MITIPVHDLLLLPGVMFYFKKDMFPDRRITAEDVGRRYIVYDAEGGEESVRAAAG